MTDNRAKKGERFVCYRLAETTETLMLADDGRDGRYRFVFAPFQESVRSPKVWIRGSKLLRGAKSLGVSVEGLELRALEGRDEESPMLRRTGTYGERFETFHRELRKGRFQKLVLSRPFDATCGDPMETFHRLCERFPHSLVYLLHTPETGTWIGATPELLLRHTCEGWDTMALAGTKYADGSNDGWDEKNRREQRLVCDYLRERLTPLCCDVTEQATTTLRTGELYHLCTKFRFTPHDDAGLTALTEALHPTPAVCGMPKEEAKRFILANEGYDRSYYAGYLGPVEADGESHLYVNIRCARLHGKGRATVYAGSGLLTSSRMEDEREEIRRKSEALFT